MNREAFKISHKHYATNSLTYILHNDEIVDSVETYSDMFYIEVGKDNWESQKKKRKPADIQNECENKIKRYIEKNK